MKSLFTFLFAGLLAISAFGQNATFQNTIGDSLWSTVGNWTGGVLPTGTAWMKADVQVNSPQTTALFEIPGGQAGDITARGSDTLLITGGNNNNGNAIRNNSNTATVFNLNGNYRIENTGGASNISTKATSGNGLVFGENSHLALETKVNVKNFGSPNTYTHFNGKITGRGVLSCINNNSNVTFGATADNSEFKGNLTIFVTDVVSNTTVPGGLAGDSTTMLFNANGGSLTVNGANTINGTLSRKGTNPFTVNVNANQENISTVTLPEGILTFSIDPSVTALHFANSNQRVWDTVGNVTFTNFKNALVRFGVSDTGLTPHQVSRIDIGGGTVGINGNGYLYDPALAVAPTVVTGISDITKAPGFGSDVVVLSPHFADADMDKLTYTATSSDGAVATVSVANDILTYTEVANGVTTIIVTADDGVTGMVSDTFTVTIAGAPNNPPVVDNAISDMVLNMVNDSTIDIGSTFSDPDGNTLTFTATSDDATVATASLTNDMLTITKADTGSTYVVVTADDGNGGTVSDTFNVDVTGTTAIADLLPIEGLKVFPNPTNGQINIRSKQAIQQGAIRVYNPTGVLVQARSINNETELTLDLSTVAAGLYLIVVEDTKAGKMSTVRILKK